MRTVRRAGLLACAAAWFCLGQTPPAHACGGTFCDSAPPGQAPMPVDQTGENVLFFMSGGTVEAHVQIQYSGDPERFAWVIPVPEIPELSVGSAPLFVRLLNGSVPSFTLNTSFQFCSADGDTSSRGGCSLPMSSAAESGGSFAPTGGTPDTKSDAPKTVLRQGVGAFEAVVLEPQSVQGLTDWLTQNGFDADAEDSTPVLQDYVSRGYKFVAIKLRPEAGVDEIHPLVIRYPGSEPCVPLKLTRVAAVEDMAVRVFFLGDRRVVPTNFKHVTLNPARLDFRALGQNYNLAVSRAVDSPVANGRGFVTEYAGASSIISTQGLSSPEWVGESFTSLDPQGALDRLTELGLLSCLSANNCSSPHPLVFPLLERHLPPPDGMTPGAYYSCLSCGADATPPAWSPDAFAADFDAMIAEPAQHAVDMLQKSPFLTRMFTRISPAEMTEDPMFAEWTGTTLPDVGTALSATLLRECDGDLSTQLSDGREIYGGSFSSAPSLPADLPWAEKIEEFTDAGAHIVLVDNTEQIDQVLLIHNAANSTRPSAGSADGSARTGGSGCGCSLPDRDAGHGLTALGFAALFALRRRRRARR